MFCSKKLPAHPQALSLESQKVFYTNEIEQISVDKKSFDNNDELLEKYAREKYLMKKESEDIFYIIEE